MRRMTLKSAILNLLLPLGFAVAYPVASNAEGTHVSQSSVRNVILIIGDGMDDQQIAIARNYLKGVTGRLVLDDMPVRSSVQVLTVDNTDPSQYLYVADSANSATAMSTGVVTSRARIATTAKEDEDIPTIIELAHQAGFKTGIVTTSTVTDATPASFAAHISLRFCETPESMVTKRFDCSKDKKSNGGPGSISEQLAVSSLNVLFGGGREHFIVNTEDGSQTIENLARDNGFDIIYTRQELIDADPGKKQLGLFAAKHLPIKLQGENGRIAEQPEVTPEGVKLPSPMRCEDNPGYKSTPSLQLMAEKALKNLSHNNDKGFFLMIESALIDKQSHVRNPCGSIGELDQLNETVASVLAFADSQPDTLVLVTADHTQAAQLVPATSLFAGLGIPIYTPGSMARIKMPDGGVMGVNYATNRIFAEEHTGAAVPLYSNDLGKERVKTYITQPDIFQIVRSFLEL
ncbi:MAG TPA: alkaline phosphatase [Gammaproteobacteria bacterium]|nr:alkaline phosphatase [Gammaproteobacteria bacterium]